VEEGEFVPEETLIGYEGNYGDVYQGGTQVTKEERLNGSTRGSHVHFQIRPVIPEKTIVSGEHYLNGKNGSRVKFEQMYLRVALKDNGYNGCTDPAPYFYTPSRLQLIGLLAKVAGYLKNKLGKI